MTKHDFWRLLDHIEPFDEQSSQASTPETGCFDTSGASSNREDVYTNESHKIYDGDISKLMGELGMKRKKVERWCDREMVKTPFFYALCLREKDFHAELTHIKLPKKVWPEYIKNWHSSATCHWFTNEKKQTVTAIVCMQDWENREDIAVYGLLVHEAVHLWQETRKLYGEEFPSSEFEAYAIQNLAQNLFQQFKDQTK